MADVALDPQNSNPKELFGQGVRAYVLQDFDTAVHAFSKVSELLTAEQGELHDSLGDVYLYYGKALLELSRKESGPLGDGVLKNIDEGEESEEIEEEGDDSEEANQETNGDSKEAETEKTEEAKPSEDEKPVDKSAGDSAQEAPSSSDKKEGEENEDALTDLQIAWEVLELAKRIFTTRGEDGKKNLAETLVVLGEVSLESGNFPSAIEDMKEGLKIQKSIYGDDSRTIAETFYKLGGALSTNGQIDEAIENFNFSYDYLNNKLNNLKKDEEHKSENADEIEELNSLMPEIQEKIADMKNLKLEVAKKVSGSVGEAAPSANGTTEAASSSKQATNISHLVKRKRKEDEEEVKEENPAKKPSP